MGCNKCFFSPRTFAIWIGLIGFTQIYCGAYTKSVLTTIERRYQLSSTISAVIATGAQIGNLTVMLFVSYFGQRYNRPKIIALGCLLMTMGYLLSALPQFIGDRYHFDDISVNITTEDGNNAVVCSTSGRNTTVDCGVVSESKASSNIFILIVVGIIINGIGGSGIQPLGYSYVDDHATEHNSALYIGIMKSIALIGPLVGYVSGAGFLKVWVDVGWVDTDTITIEPRHTAWVGAWWLGFVIAALLMISSSLPVWFYPKEIEKEKDDDKDKDVELPPLPENKKDLDVKPAFKQNAITKELSGIWLAIKKLVRNIEFVLVVSSFTCEMFKISSVSTFIVKYLEVGFGKSAATSSFLIGVINFPFLILGTVLGSFIVKRWKLGKVGIIRLLLTVYISTIVVFFAFLFVGCESIDMAGLTVSYPTRDAGKLENTPVSECNAACECDENVYTPVCGPGQISYVSPCFAGCTDSIEKGGSITNYTLCSCVSNSPEEQVVSIGRCYTSKCEGLAEVVIGIKTFMNFIAGTAATPLFVLLMRTLTPADKAFGIGIAYFVGRLVGWIPAPILVGYAIDEACLFWTKADCSGRSYCRLFDNDLYRRSYSGILISVKFISTCIMLYLYRVVCRSAKADKENKEEKSLNAEQHPLTHNGGKAKDKETVV